MALITRYYQTKTYKQLLENICRAAGIEPDRLLSDDALAIRDYINTAMRKGWEYYQWPDLMESEAATVGTISNYLAYDLFHIFKYDPKDKAYPEPYRYFVDASGINILPDLASTGIIYPKWRYPWYAFEGIEYAAGTTYSIGDMAYSSAIGDYHRSIIDNNTGNAVTDTASWDRREIPGFLYEFIKLQALSELREAEGQGAKAAILERKSWHSLTLEIEKWERQKNQQLHPNTHVYSGG